MGERGGEREKVAGRDWREANRHDEERERTDREGRLVIQMVGGRAGGENAGSFGGDVPGYRTGRRRWGGEDRRQSVLVPTIFGTEGTGV